MPRLEWSDDFALQPQMDDTHHEFIGLLAGVEAALWAERTDLLAQYARLLEHTIEHFAQEGRWMAATGFAAENCHAFQHQAVLQVMREVDRRAREENDFEPLERAVAELATWFPMHAETMDAALAHHMAQVGFDPLRPQAIETREEQEALITGCGSNACT
jgi:hemerythrin-like metal-binding protein